MGDAGLPRRADGRTRNSGLAYVTSFEPQDVEEGVHLTAGSRRPEASGSRSRRSNDGARERRSQDNPRRSNDRRRSLGGGSRRRSIGSNRSAGGKDGDFSHYPTGTLALDITWSSWSNKPTNVLYLDKALDLGPGFERNWSNKVVKGCIDPQQAFYIVHPLDLTSKPPLSTEISVVRLVGDDTKRNYVLRRIRRPQDRSAKHGGSNRKRLVKKVLNTFMPRVWCIFVTDSAVYTLEEFMPRHNLVSYLSGGPRDDLLRLYAAEMLLMLKMFHKNRIVLRDLAPNKLLMTRTGHVRVIDTRFQWSVMEHSGWHERDRSDFTSYSAPETALRGQALPASDLWSLGATLLTLATGIDVFLDVPVNESAYGQAVVSLLRRPPSGVEFSAELSSFLESLLQVAPEARITVRQALTHPFVSGIDSITLNEHKFPLKKLELMQRSPALVVHSITAKPDWDRSIVSPLEMSVSIPSVAKPVNEQDEDEVERGLFRLPVARPARQAASSSAFMRDAMRFPRPSKARTWSQLDRAVAAQETAQAAALDHEHYEEGGEVEAVSGLTPGKDLRFEPMQAQGGDDDGGDGDAKGKVKDKGKDKDKGKVKGNGKGKAAAADDDDWASQASRDSRVVYDGGLLFRGRDSKKLNWFDFVSEQLLGTGSFGRVILTYLEADSARRRFAVKVVRKDKLKRAQVSLTGNREWLVMKALRGRSFVPLYHAFEDSKYIYLVMMFCEGGTLRGAMSRIWNGRPMKLAEARFYLEQIVLALRIMHDKGILYRDLKPSNLLLTHDGHLRIADFGLARYLPGFGPDGPRKGASTSAKTDAFEASFVGTPFYISPEAIESHEYRYAWYGRSVDAWALGIIAYEMLVGHRPFQSESKTELYEMIRDAPIDYSKIRDPTARSLVESLLTRDPKHRLGTTMRIQDHAFFAVTDWRAVVRRDVVPPYVPDVKAGEFSQVYFQR